MSAPLSPAERKRASRRPVLAASCQCRGCVSNGEDECLFSGRLRPEFRPAEGLWRLVTPPAAGELRRAA